jgi:sulfatase modifying factor 1
MLNRTSLLSAVAVFTVACSSTSVLRPQLDVAELQPRADKIPVALKDEVTVVIPSVHLSACAEGMVEIEGDYCPVVEEKCLTWVDVHGAASKEAIPKPGQSGRCGEFQSPTKCLSKNKIHVHYCIDAYEYPNVPGQRPQSWMTWYSAKAALEAEDKRMCSASEWTFACEGEAMQPYPYGDGYHRDSTACNFDNLRPKGLDVFQSKRPGDTASLWLDSMLVPAGSMERCVSPFGVHDMVGNIDEWVHGENGQRRSLLKSGHIFGVRNACRPVTDGHGPTFGWYETGTRGCSDVNTLSP